MQRVCIQNLNKICNCKYLGKCVCMTSVHSSAGQQSSITRMNKCLFEIFRSNGLGKQVMCVN